MRGCLRWRGSGRPQMIGPALRQARASPCQVMIGSISNSVRHDPTFPVSLSIDPRLQQTLRLGVGRQLRHQHCRHYPTQHDFAHSRIRMDWGRFILTILALGIAGFLFLVSRQPRKVAREPPAATSPPEKKQVCLDPAVVGRPALIPSRIIAPGSPSMCYTRRLAMATQALSK